MSNFEIFREIGLKVCNDTWEMYNFINYLTIDSKFQKYVNLD